MSSINTVVRQAPFLLVGQLYMNAASLGATMLLTRAFDPQSFGLITFATSIVNLLAPLGLLGLQAGLERFVAFLGGEASWEQVQALRRKVFRFLTVLNLLLFVPIAVGSALLGERLLHKDNIGMLVAVLALALIVNWVSLATAAIFSGLRRMRTVALLLYVLPATGNLSVAVVFYCLHLGHPLSWAVCMAAVYLGVALYSLRALRQVAPGTQPNGGPPVLALRSVLAFSFPLFFSSLVLVIHQNFDLVLLGRFQSPADVAEYRVYKYFPLFLFQFLGAIVAVVQPEIASLIGARASEAQLRQFYLRIAKWEVIIASVMSLMIFNFSPILLPLLFGPDYRVNEPLTFLVLLGVPWLVGLVGPCASTLLAHGHTRLLMVNGGISAATAVGLALWLVPRYGTLGAAVATLSNMGINQGLAFVQVYRRLGLQPYSGRLLWFVCIALATTLLGELPDIVYPGCHWAVGLATGMAATGCLAGALLLLRLMDAEDIALLQRLGATVIRALASLRPLLPTSGV